ncbi:type II toxin-antitoxin system RelE/ParE family toxin [bacterium]|nr:type II toxin-antitoxin system RelE/ParE family toxin [bacterium]
MKKYRVFFVAEAEQDLLDIYNYVATYDSVGQAEALLQSLEMACYRLATFPRRGRIPPELERIGVLEYRETFYKPYRIIYEIMREGVYIHGIFDGRRELQELLQFRLLR